ncbi:nitronate monooxygenase family protein [Marinitoga sp. 1137]|uniref:NAD(P)H-dependent flavin oxidoreductase n=1 Tax=Marinitoga sp. 1137 TaxID=1545835 RepID=UPI0009FAAEA9
MNDHRSSKRGENIFKGLKIGELTTKYPLVQGGMAVGISLDNLAGAVAKAGGIGVIGTAGIGLFENMKNYKEASKIALKKFIRSAKEKANGGVVGVNIMVALTNYSDMVKTAIDEGIDIIFSGAGLPLSLPSYLTEKTKLVPIVSSVKAAQVIIKRWVSKYNYIPDAIVLEGPKAGGHLGFKNKEEIFSEKNSLENIVPQLKEFLISIEKKYGKKIPLIAGGGLFSKDDVKKILDLGADGVQMATRFIATEECDAHENFKKAIINAKSDDITIIKSPVGMPGRAIKNNFIVAVENGEKKPFECRYHCIKTCDFKTTPYCIAKALYNAAIGDLENGFVFTGASVEKITKIEKVENIIKELFE